MKHKRKRPKARRAGCLMCKPHKLTGEKKVKELPQSELPPRHRSKKKTRKWCKGKVGISHEPAWVPSESYGWLSVMRPNYEYEHQVYKCRNCGKILDWRTLHKVCGKVHNSWHGCEEGKET